jgi:hypothetical protein
MRVRPQPVRLPPHACALVQRRNGGAGAGRAQRLASQLQRTSEHQSESIHSTVNSLQSYLLVNSSIKVFALADAEDGSLDVRPLHAHTWPLHACPLRRRCACCR